MEEQDVDHDNDNSQEDNQSNDSEDQTLQSTSEYKLNPPPSGCISTVCYSPVDEILLVCSWDKYVRVYNSKTSVIQTQYTHHGAVLDCCFSDSSMEAFSGGMDKVVKMFNLSTNVEAVLGEHDMPVRHVRYMNASRLAVSGSWDSTIKIWDPRTRQATGKYQQPGKVYALDTTGNRIIVGTSDKHVWTWDIRQMNEPEQKKTKFIKISN